ncbi:MAG: CRISPR-associated protein Cas4 [Thermoplasmata archaeon]
MGEEWISAGDIEKYGYCPLSWWLSSEEQEVIDKNLEKGIQKHKEFGDKLGDVKEKEERSRKLESIILWLAVASSIVSVIGLTLLNPDEYIHQIFMVTSLIWLLAATFLLYLSERGLWKDESLTAERVILIFAMVATIMAVVSLTLYFADFTLARVTQLLSLSWLIGASYWLKYSLSLQSEADKKRKELDVLEGEVEYIDRLKEESKILASERYKIRGRPDYIIEKEGKKVPVEVKTGRVPRGPFFSHILQVAAYCLLLEEQEGEAPPFGIIKYGEKEFEVDYDESLKELLIKKVEEMREAVETGEVHRNHNREGKCIHCSRREICPERLV